MCGLRRDFEIRQNLIFKGNTAQFPPCGLSTAPAAAARHLRCQIGLRYPHRASGAKAPRTLRPLPPLRFAVSATGGAHLCSIQYYLRFWLGICRTSLAVSALRIMRYCPKYARMRTPITPNSSLLPPKLKRGSPCLLPCLSVWGPSGPGI